MIAPQVKYISFPQIVVMSSSSASGSRASGGPPPANAVDLPRVLLYLAVGLAGFTAVVHLLLGLGGLYEYAVDGVETILPPLFVLAALAVFAFLVGLYRGYVAPPAAYLLGAVLMAAHILAYVDWHVLGVAEATLGLEEYGHSHDNNDHNGHDHNDHNGHDGHDGHDHDHDGSVLEVLGDHLVADPVALVTKFAETVSAVAFAWLAILDFDE